MVALASFRAGCVEQIAGQFRSQGQKISLRCNSLRSTERKLFSLYTNTNSYKDNTVFDGLVAQAIKQLALLTKSHSIDIY